MKLRSREGADIDQLRIESGAQVQGALSKLNTDFVRRCNLVNVFLE